MPWESGNDIAVRIIEVYLLLRSKEGNKAWRLFVITGLREKREYDLIELGAENRRAGRRLGMWPEGQRCAAKAYEGPEELPVIGGSLEFPR